jgi:hypothetical protein
MYFTTFNHYDDDNIDIYIDRHNDTDMCLICWEPSTTNNNICKMTSSVFNLYFYKSCTCNASFHHPCLLKWINKTNSCPICRSKIQRHIDDDENLPLTFNILKYLKLFKYICMVLFIRILYDIMFGIQYHVEKKIQNNQSDLL